MTLNRLLAAMVRSTYFLALLVTLTAGTARAQEPAPRDSARTSPATVPHGSAHTKPTDATQGREPLSTADGVYTLDQARRGKDVFALACQSCHSPTLHAGAPFRNKWFGRPLSELFGYLRREMPKTEPGMLTNEDYALVTAYLLRINGMPTGRTPLAADSAALQHITLDSVPKRENRTPTEERP